MSRRSKGACLVFAVVVVASSTRWGQAQTPSDKATAQAQFDAARQLMAEGKNAEACPKLEDSQRLDPSLGTLLRLATCYEKIGRTASAWALYGEAAAGAKAANQPEREKYANDHAEALEAKLCKLTIVVPKASELEGLEVRRDGKPLSRAQWGTPVPVDPGTIALEASAPGKRTWTTNVALTSEGQHESVTVPALTEAPIAAPAPAPSPSADRGADGGKQRTIGFAVGAIGIVGVTIGSIYGLRAMSRNDDSSSHCRTATLCDGDGLSLREDARRFATISTIAFVAGGVALASGAVLVLTARGPRSSVSVGVGTVPSTAATGMWLSGSW